MKSELKIEILKTVFQYLVLQVELLFFSFQYSEREKIMNGFLIKFGSILLTIANISSEVLDSPPPECKAGDTSYANAKDCGTFYSCIRGNPILHSCSAGYYYDISSKVIKELPRFLSCNFYATRSYNSDNFPNI